MSTLEKILVVIFTVILSILFFAILCAWPFMLLWNWLMPEIFGLCTLTFWQSCGLLVLSGLLFKSTIYSSSK